MEIQTISLEHWMCRICLGKGTHDIFEEQLVLPKNEQLPLPSEHHQGQPSSTSHLSSNDSISIIDALNYFSEFKICKPDTVNEPVMLCQSCHAELASCVNFRRKLNESEALLRKDYTTLETDEETEEGKTGLTMGMDDIEPFLEEDEPEAPASPPITYQEMVKPSKIHHAMPRFRLTNQVSNILRHVTTTSSSSSGSSAIDIPLREKRKESDNQSDSETPKKIHRRDSQEALLEKTLIVPHYIFASEVHQSMAPDSDESTSDSPEANPVRLDTEEIFHCKHCPKAFSTPQHLASHTKNVHLCQYCSRHFPTILAKNKHNREEHKSFQCAQCSFQSRYAANLKSHLRKMHSTTT